LASIRADVVIRNSGAAVVGRVPIYSDP
jgi:hypothetical protein